MKQDSPLSFWLPAYEHPSRVAMTTPEAQAPSRVWPTLCSHWHLPVPGYCCLLLCRKMALLPRINPAGWGLCVLSLQADQCVRVEEQ